jgi:hypothetical protein
VAAKVAALTVAGALLAPPAAVVLVRAVGRAAAIAVAVGGVVGGAAADPTADRPAEAKIRDEPAAPPQS